MRHHSEAFIGIDTSKSRNAVAIAEGGRGGEVRFLGEFPATDAAMRKLIAKLAAKYSRLTFCYEAGPTGYGLYRLIKSLGYECIVVAPSLIPKKPGDRVKTNRRDAVSLTKLLRAGELTAVWVPDERHEAMRDLSRARLAAKKDLQGKRQQISSLMGGLGLGEDDERLHKPRHGVRIVFLKSEPRYNAVPRTGQRGSPRSSKPSATRFQKSGLNGAALMTWRIVTSGQQRRNVSSDLRAAERSPSLA